ncbi:hypothetical protein EYC84_000470 [Monilinia fructicola]|uniref:Uncharacterized protein n=1 Tax=Monilinia fructicola TaxID=38448 RepID=A0A5M9JWE7_MONFR|nr:hypothetical protein EYC84_000470 [Monilinia fructicola]
MGLEHRFDDLHNALLGRNFGWGFRGSILWSGIGAPNHKLLFACLRTLHLGKTSHLQCRSMTLIDTEWSRL